jgi:hypothetical protein
MMANIWDVCFMLMVLLVAGVALALAEPSAAPAPAPWTAPVSGVAGAGDPCGVADPPRSCAGSKTVLRVAAIQLTDFADGVNRSASDETRARTEKAVRYLEQAAQLGVEVAVLPEMGLVHSRRLPLIHIDGELAT